MARTGDRVASCQLCCCCSIASLATWSEVRIDTREGKRRLCVSIYDHAAHLNRCLLGLCLKEVGVEYRSTRDVGLWADPLSH